jgi:NADH dehydrogenase FAD-containing subunit
MHTLGLAVAVVDPAPAAFGRALGLEFGSAVQRHLEQAGIRFLTDAGVSAYTGTEAVTGVTLAGGETVPAGLVVEAVGSICNTDWLGGNGLDLSDGVLTDNDLRAVGAEHVVAVGDVARFPNPLFDEVPRRVEHWSMPVDTAKRAAATLMTDLKAGEPPGGPFAPTPSFWSDLLDLRLQAYGTPALGDAVEMEEGDLDNLVDGVVVSYLRDSRPVGAVAVNIPPARLRALRDRFAVPAAAH